MLTLTARQRCCCPQQMHRWCSIRFLNKIPCEGWHQGRSSSENKKIFSYNDIDFRLKTLPSLVNLIKSYDANFCNFCTWHWSWINNTSPKYSGENVMDIRQLPDTPYQFAVSPSLPSPQPPSHPLVTSFHFFFLLTYNQTTNIVHLSFGNTCLDCIKNVLGLSLRTAQ